MRQGYYKAHGAVLALLLLGSCAYAPVKVASPSRPVEEKPSAAVIPAQPVITPLPSIVPAPRPLPAPAPEVRAAVRTAATLPTVALLLPMSGQHAALGQSMFNAAQMALFEGGGKLNLRPYDTQDGVGMAGTAVRLANADSARIALGPVFGSQVTPAVRSGGMPVISFSNDRSIAGKGVYVIGLMPHQQVERVVQHAASQGIKRFAAVIPNNAFGESVVQSMNIALGQSGGTLLVTERTDGSRDSLKRSWQNLLRYAPLSEHLAKKLDKAAGKATDDKNDKNDKDAPEESASDNLKTFQALFIGLSGDSLVQFARLMKADPIADADKIQLLGSYAWYSPATLREPSLQGAWFAMPSPSSHNQFVSRYRSTYGKEPVALASMAYDATALVVALQRSGQGFTSAALENPAGFAGVDGVFRFLKNGQNQRGLAVVEITGNSVRETSPAPAQFYAY